MISLGKIFHSLKKIMGIFRNKNNKITIENTLCNKYKKIVINKVQGANIILQNKPQNSIIPMPLNFDDFSTLFNARYDLEVATFLKQILKKQSHMSDKICYTLIGVIEIIKLLNDENEINFFDKIKNTTIETDINFDIVTFGKIISDKT